MSKVYLFQPARSQGILFQAGIILLLAAAALLGLWQASLAQVGPVFILYLIPALLAASLAPYFIYRFQGLRTAQYIVERDGIHLQWGIRIEDIPMDQVLWVGRADKLGVSFSLPWPRWPGCVYGIRRLPDSRELEFLAAKGSDLVFIATPGRVFAISPSDSEGFLETYQRFSELGSLSPLAARSQYPNSLWFQFWADRPARYLFLAGAIFGLALLTYVSLAIPAREHVSLRLAAGGGPGEIVPSVRLLLLPVLNTFFLAADTLVGLFYYRYKEKQPIAYLLWGSGALTSVIFLWAVFFILRAG